MRRTQRTQKGPRISCFLPFTFSSASSVKQVRHFPFFLTNETSSLHSYPCLLSTPWRSSSRPSRLRGLIFGDGLRPLGGKGSPSSMTGSVCVKNLLHLGPPFTRGTRGNRFLHGIHDGPPLSGFRVSRHLGHICLEIVSNVFEIRKKSIVLKEDAVVSDVAVANGLENFRPDIGMVFNIVLFHFRPEPN